MTTPKFTPGPWGLGDSYYGGQSAIIAEDDSIVGYASRVESNWRENATLIASAPDLYAALERLLETTRAMAREYRIPGSAYGFDTNLAETALAKARGMKGE